MRLVRFRLARVIPRALFQEKDIPYFVHAMVNSSIQQYSIQTVEGAIRSDLLLPFQRLLPWWKKHLWML